jgi:hypothetical protein
MLSLSIWLQCLKSIAGRNTEIIEHFGLIQQTKLSRRDILDIGRQSSTAPPGPDRLRLRIGKALNHDRL